MLQVCALPEPRLPARLPEHPAVDVGHHAGLHGEGQEAPDENEPALRMTPAPERLRAHDRALPQRHDRLVVEQEFVLLERPQQVGPELDPLDELGQHVRGEDLATALAGWRTRPH